MIEKDKIIIGMGFYLIEENRIVKKQVFQLEAINSDIRINGRYRDYQVFKTFELAKEHLINYLVEEIKTVSQLKEEVSK